MWKIKAYTPVPEGERTCEKRMKARTRWGGCFENSICKDFIRLCRSGGGEER